MKIRQIIKLLCVSMMLVSPPVFATSILTPMTDATNSGIINTKILIDKDLSDLNIDATVVNGVAIFTGTVKNQAQVDELARIAKSISGIKSIDTSKLKVQ